ncbi:MAG: DUF4252 domain-containing protein [Candidatus Sulfotelmatobacter sp.]
MNECTQIPVPYTQPMWGQPPRLSSRAKRGLLVATAVLLFATATHAAAQAFKVPPSIEHLSATAKETVEVTMDGPMLRWASKFLSSEDPEEARTAKMVSNLKSIYVRSYEFDHEGGYSHADIEELRAQMQRPDWNKIVGVRSQTNGENVDVFIKIENDKMAGIVVIAAEPRELTFVHIDGPIEIDQLADLGGQFGVPKLDTKNVSKPIAKVEKGDRK